MNFRFHVQAREEYRHAALHYAGRGRRLGEEFIARLEQALASVRRLPRARRALDASGVRHALLQQFPYVLIYAIEVDAANQPFIAVYAVAHTKRKPGYWRGRLPSKHREDT